MSRKPVAGVDKDGSEPSGGITLEAGELHRLLVNRVQDYAIFALDANGFILTWNPGARRLKGYTQEEAVGRHFSMFYPPEDIAARKIERELATAIAEGSVEDEGWRLRKDGSRFWANVLITALRDEGGELIGFAKVTRDLTERRSAELRAIDAARRLAARDAERAAAEERADELRELAAKLALQTAELERRTKEAEKANRAKGEFLAAMSHELRTPLNAISGYTQLLKMGLSGPLTDEQQHQLDRIQSSQEHLLGIINDILNFSRVEAGQIAYDIGPLRARNVLDAVLQMVALQAEAKRIELKIGRCPPELEAYADRSKVDQIILNLLTNAVKFTNEGGQIELSCGKQRQRAWLRVRDTGIGIPADHLESIFEPFVQVGRSLARPKEGTGLGLAISRDLARAMDGDLEVTSTEGEGSTFTLFLPASAPEGTGPLAR